MGELCWRIIINNYDIIKQFQDRQGWTLLLLKEMLIGAAVKKSKFPLASQLDFDEVISRAIVAKHGKIYAIKLTLECKELNLKLPFLPKHLAHLCNLLELDLDSSDLEGTISESVGELVIDLV